MHSLNHNLAYEADYDYNDSSNKDKDDLKIKGRAVLEPIIRTMNVEMYH